MQAPVINILPLTTIERERVLPIPGRVVARQGQKVAPRDVIAETDLAPEHIILNIAQGLGVSIEQADDAIQRIMGDDVKEGDIVAGPVGITRRVVRAPVDGRIMLAGEGQVLLRIEKPPFALRAGITGEVSELIPEYGAVVATEGALIQGVWGNGRADFGLLQSKIETPDDELNPVHIDVSLRGSIVLGGYCADATVLQKAAEVPIRGLIVTSISANLIPLAKKVSFPVIALEGFGQIPMNSVSYKLLTSNSNREVAINAEALNLQSGHRPEVIIPLPATREAQPPSLLEPLNPGQTVRISRHPYQAQTGTIELLYNDPIVLPNGLRAAGALIALNDDHSVQVPLANLEVIA